LANLKGGWIVGGYLSNWIPLESPDFLRKGFRVVQDILPTSLSVSADILLPAAAWAEKSGTWENHQGKLQPFDAAVPPPEGAKREGDVYYTLLARPGMYHAESVRQEMGLPFAAVTAPAAPKAEPAPQFVEL
jgi:NADH-quinone oxidoreductase subunit G